MKTKSTSETARKPSCKNTIPLAIAAVALLASSAFAADTTWTGAVDNDWFEPGNWDPGIPDASTNALINNGGTAQIAPKLQTAVALSLTLGQNVGDSGTVSVGAPHGDMAVAGTIFVGYRGTGTLNITSLGGVRSGGASIASLTGQLWISSGAATVDGAVSSWTIDGELDVGGTTTAAGGTGLLTVTNGGAVSAGTSVHVWNSGTLTGNGTVNVNSGSGTATFDGTLAPKGGGTTLTLVGNLQLKGGSTTQCNVTPQDSSTTPQVGVSAQVSLGGHLLVTMTGDFSSAPTRFTLLSTNTFDVNHLTFDSTSITYPTGHCWHPVITYDYSGGHVYLDRVSDCN